MQDRDYQNILLLFNFNGLVITIPMDTQDIHTTATYIRLQVDIIITGLGVVILTDISFTHHIRNRQNRFCALDTWTLVRIISLYGLL